jgi:hypothetical protein
MYMIEEAQTALSAWESFYVIVGSSGAALTGLQFVVMALIAESPIKGSPRQISAFGTPVIVHFSAVLLFAAILSSPWQGLRNVSIVLAVLGAIGIVYGIIVTYRAKTQTGYTPVFEDWLWHSILPLIAYTTIFISALLLQNHARETLFIIGSVELLLLFIGIHNSWDTVTYVAFTVRDKKNGASEPQPSTTKNKPHKTKR